MKSSLLSNPQFRDGRTGAAIAVNVKVNAVQNRVLRISREGKVYIQLTTKTKSEIDAGLLAFMTALLGVKPHQVELLGSFPSNERLVTITGLSAEELQRKIITALG
jgi:hypothetical protein